MVAALAAAGFLVGRRTAGPASAPPPETADRQVLYWQAPMNPQEIYDRPGKSAMGMDLVPVYADEEEADRTISIDPVTTQNMGVRTAQVKRMDLSRAIRTVGTIEYNEEALHVVNVRISGWIETLHVDFVGAYVREGDPLIEVYSPELVTAQQDYLLALEMVEDADSNGRVSLGADAGQLLKAARQRLEHWDISPVMIEQVAQAREVTRTVVLTAPATGVVTALHVMEGGYVQAGTDLYRIADLSTVWVHASLYDIDLPWIALGQTATMQLSYLPGKTYVGRVSYIYPFLREDARDNRIRLVFDNPGYSLKPGMYVNVMLQGRTHEDALVVPSEAILYVDGRHTVFVVRAPGRFEPREIEIAGEEPLYGDYTQVIAGLAQSEEVVTSAQFLLDSESRLQEAIRKMISSSAVRPSAGHQHP